MGTSHSHIVRVNGIGPRLAEFDMCITKRYKLNIVQIHAPTTSHSEEGIHSFYNDVDETLGKPNHYMIVMGYFYENDINLIVNQFQHQDICANELDRGMHSERICFNDDSSCK